MFFQLGPAQERTPRLWSSATNSQRVKSETVSLCAYKVYLKEEQDFFLSRMPLCRMTYSLPMAKYQLPFLSTTFYTCHPVNFAIKSRRYLQSPSLDYVLKTDTPSGECFSASQAQPSNSPCGCGHWLLLGNGTQLLQSGTSGPLRQVWDHSVFPVWLCEVVCRAFKSRIHKDIQNY